MAKYHYNPETGAVGPCEAEVRCPWSDYPSPAEARSAYEASMSGELFQQLKKKPSLESLLREFPDPREDRKLDGGLFWELQDRAKEARDQLPENTAKLLELYSSLYYHKVNSDSLKGEHSDELLREGSSVTYGQLGDGLDRFLKANRSGRRQVVFRGVKEPNSHDPEQQAQVALWEASQRLGGTVDFRGFTSTTHDMDTARFFAGGRGVVLELLTDKGYEMGTMELELLLERDTSWLVADKRRVLWDGIEVEVVQLVDRDLLKR